MLPHCLSFHLSHALTPPLPNYTPKLLICMCFPCALFSQLSHLMLFSNQNPLLLSSQPSDGGLCWPISPSHASFREATLPLPIQTHLDLASSHSNLYFHPNFLFCPLPCFITLLIIKRKLQPPIVDKIKGEKQKLNLSCCAFSSGSSYIARN